MLKKSRFVFLSFALFGAPAAHAADKPAPAAPAAANDAASGAAAGVRASIQALGAKPGTRQISAIVFKAVRSSPENVLPIVDAAVRVSPPAAASEIVTAATAAVPNPWKQVTYRRLTVTGQKKSASEGKSVVNLSRNAPDFKGVSGPAEPDGRTMTLAEAIAKTAFDAQPGLSLTALQTAVDNALLTDPDTLLRSITGARNISGVGIAGSSNYSNEPRRSTLTTTTPVPTPNQPVVSQ